MLSDGLVWLYTVLAVTAVVGMVLGIGMAMHLDRLEDRPKDDAFAVLSSQFRETLRRIQAAIRMRFE